jgi:DNA-binding transcriptional LysR family regulator
VPFGGHNILEAAAAGLKRGVSDDAPKGLVRINAPPSLTQVFLISFAAPLTTLHASLDLDLVSDLRYVSLERRETDIAIRLGRPEDGDFVAKKLTTVGYGFYASARWRARCQKGIVPTFVSFDEMNTSVPEHLLDKKAISSVAHIFRTNSQLGQAQAAGANAGVALLPHFVGRSNRALKQCSLGVDLPSATLAFGSAERSQGSLRRTVVDFLTDLFHVERSVLNRLVPTSENSRACSVVETEALFIRLRLD